jgi:hypothetical protein
MDDHHRAEQYSASQMMRGEVIRAERTSIARTFDPPVFKTVASFSALSTEIVYAQPIQKWLRIDQNRHLHSRPILLSMRD